MERHEQPALRTSPRSVAFLKVLAAAAALAVFQPSTTYADEKDMPRTITVTASGTVEAEPDRARITLGVTTQAPSARQAMTENNEAMGKVLSELKAKGIDAKDIQTAAFNVEPVIDYSKDGAPPKTTAYRVGNQVTVLVRDLSRLGAVLDDVNSAGANQVQGLAFEVSKADTLKDDARRQAVAKALQRAKLLATSAGAEVGDVMQISEEASNGPITYATARFAKAEAAAPIERGTTTLEARVTATWALK